MDVDGDVQTGAGRLSDRLSDPPNPLLSRLSDERAPDQPAANDDSNGNLASRLGDLAPLEGSADVGSSSLLGRVSQHRVYTLEESGADVARNRVPREVSRSTDMTAPLSLTGSCQSC